jgi:Ca-activated chloride channel family protein
MTLDLAEWTLQWPWLLLALPLPWLALRVLPAVTAASSAALRVPFGNELRSLSEAAARRPRSRLQLLPLLAWALLCFAAARPLELGEPIAPPQLGRDLLLVVDLSGSMAEQDMTLGNSYVDRLTAAKAVLSDFLDRRVGDRVGLLLFGQRAYAVTPLTPDRESVRQQLLDSEVGMAGQETAIGDAIALGVKRLSDQPDLEAGGGERVIILLTDGVNTAGALTPDKATELAKAQGVRIHTIGFGGNGGQSRFFGLAMGQQAQIDEEGLSRMAQETGGRYFRARDTNELAGIYAEIDRIEPTARAGEVLRPRIERYPLPLGLALALGLAGLLLQLTPRRIA